MQAQAAESRRRFAMARPYHSVGALQLEERKRPPATPDNLLRSSSYGASEPPPLFELRRVRKREKVAP